MNPEVDGAAFYMVFIEASRPWLYTESYYRQSAFKTLPKEIPSQIRLAYERRLFGATHHLEWDKQFRILIPERVVKRFPKLRGEITLVGVRHRLELWAREEWNIERERLMEDRLDLDMFE